MADKPYQDKEWLREQYVDKRKSMYEIGDECGVTGTTISRYMEEFGIEKRSQSEAQIDEPKRFHNDEWLRTQYIDNRKSMAEIAEMCDVTASSVKKWIDRFGIETRDYADHLRTAPASFFTVERGYEKVCSKYEYETDMAMVHQLVMIAEGANPAKVFSNGRYHVHHKNSIYWDNRPENLELKAAKVHGSDHVAPDSRSVPQAYVTDATKEELLVELRQLIGAWREQDNSALDMCADELHALLSEL